ncbi:MAG: YbhB/YbcL family Raf kinase inhibitor-like protein [Gammaproteobacteria bacterium]|nr:YbhB/YbcL family Raf kinase inhibitor-like protein [Gammaproteobacteria bacterium]
MFLRFSTRVLRTICVVGFLGVNPVSSEETKSLSIESPAFSHDAAIPAKYTCKREDISPALIWSGVPEGARSLVLIVDDPDAPDPRAPRMTWVHWVLYNIPPDATSLPEGVLPDRLPPGTKEGINDWKRAGYGGPCPPIGRHRYFHKLYALDLELEEMKTPTKARIEAAMQGHVIAQAELVGTFAK